MTTAPPDEQPEGDVSMAATVAGPDPQLEVSGVARSRDRIGRFILLERLGAGAMGEVFAAFDTTLDRKVALKVIQAQVVHTPQMRLRLLREAQAMAQISHPNVVTVHEVGITEDDVFIAMEFIRGHTLHAWLRAAPRSLPEILATFVQAGQGLAAAHAAGLVHRDFKPTNVMIGADGRVRVLDFGLARVDPLASPSESASALRLDLTQAGELVGTPLYMSHERFLGLTPGPASDQYSFCASLYEAVYGAPPFRAETVAGLVDRLRRFTIHEPPRGNGVPAWLRAALLRGLRPRPEERFPDMAALLAEISRDPARTRRRVGLAAAFGAAAALTGYLVAGGAEPTCSGGQVEIAAVWGPGPRAAVEQALAASGSAFATELWPNVAAGLDAYVERWRRTHRAACEARRRGEHSDALLDRRMACLTRHKLALAAAVEVLQAADRPTTLQALRVVSDLPPPARCDDLVALAEDGPPPPEPAVATEVAEVRRELSTVEALTHAGRAGEAGALAEDLMPRAAATGYAPLHAEALLTAGLAATDVADYDRADSRLGEAMFVGLGARLDALAAEALIRRIFILGRKLGGGATSVADESLARSLLARLPSADELRELLLNNLGVSRLMRGQIGEARAFFVDALDLHDRRAAPEDPGLADLLANLALVTDEPGERERLLARAVAVAENNLGPAHPHTVEMRLAACAQTRDPVAAHDRLRPGCDALGRFLPEEYGQQARCLYYLGLLAAEADRPQAAELFSSARALLDQLPAGDVQISSVERALMIGFDALHGPAPVAAAPTLERALADAPCPDLERWWSCLSRAELLVVLALDLSATPERKVDALTYLGEAVDILVRIESKTHDVFAQQRRASAELELAELLLALPPDVTGADAIPRARALLTRAAAWYGEGGPSYAWRMQRIGRIEALASEASRAGGPKGE